MVNEATRTITTIRQMEASLDNNRSQRSSLRNSQRDDDLKITFPLTRCLKVLKEKHAQVSRAHRERFEQIKSASSPPPFSFLVSSPRPC